MRYLIEINGNGRYIKDNINDARAIAMRYVRDGYRAWFYDYPDKNYYLGCVLWDYDGLRWWFDAKKGKTYLLNPDGSIKMSNDEYHRRKRSRKAKAKTNQMGLDWNIGEEL